MIVYDTTLIKQSKEGNVKKVKEILESGKTDINGENINTTIVYEISRYFFCDISI